MRQAELYLCILACSACSVAIDGGGSGWIKWFSVMKENSEWPTFFLCRMVRRAEVVLRFCRTANQYKGTSVGNLQTLPLLCKMVFSTKKKLLESRPACCRSTMLCLCLNLSRILNHLECIQTLLGPCFFPFALLWNTLTAHSIKGGRRLMKLVSKKCLKSSEDVNSCSGQLKSRRTSEVVVLWYNVSTNHLRSFSGRYLPGSKFVGRQSSRKD
mmetsp:Transcript_3217/g.4676  ORF Transcript_3217/g.4676 Transcript_3217/m.4676 type:complete len:213 (+) Transcript_3217:184-822(+)